MKKLLPLIFLTGCSTFDMPNTALTVEKEVQAMSRNEVIMAIQDCESNRTRAVMILAKRKISGYWTRHCPRRGALAGCASSQEEYG